jgi:rRNA maturation protein Nop10
MCNGQAREVAATHPPRWARMDSWGCYRRLLVYETVCWR